MPAYNFMDEFAAAVASGEKPQTIRRKRKRPTVPGDMLSLYTGQRTPACRLLLRVPCAAVTPITIDPWGVQLERKALRYRRGYLPYEDANEFIHRDGFSTWSELLVFFRDRYGLPTRGLELVEWKPEDREEAPDEA